MLAKQLYGKVAQGMNVDMVNEWIAHQTGSVPYHVSIKKAKTKKSNSKAEAVQITHP